MLTSHEANSVDVVVVAIVIVAVVVGVSSATLGTELYKYLLSCV